MYTVYKHTFPNNKVYIGITKLPVLDRWRNGKGYKNQSLMYKAIQKYGWENIIHEILFEKLTKEIAEQKERQLIFEYKSNDSRYGYNIENGGNCKGKMSEEERKKRSAIFSGKNNPMYGIKRCGSDNPMFGKRWTEEQKKAHSKKIKGKLAGEKNPMYGKHWTKEQKEKISEKMSGVNNPRARTVICIDTGEIFPCVTIAAKKMNINSNCIYQCCSGKTKTA